MNREAYIRDSEFPRLVIIGGGFAGINLAKKLRRAPYQVVLVDANNFHQFQPLLYQVATCGIEPDAIIFPLRKLFVKHKNFTFRMAEVQRVDPDEKRVYTNMGYFSYDKLIIATGSVTNFFGNEGLEKHCIGMKNIRESLDIRSLVLQNLERAAASCDPQIREACTNFAVIGGGPAGVETAGALAEFKKYILCKDYPDLDIKLMNIYLIQSGSQLLKGMSQCASDAAYHDLTKMGVQVILETRVKDYDGLNIETQSGTVLQARAVVWTAGVCGKPPTGVMDASRMAGGRLQVNAFHQVEDHSDVYALGDAACMISEEFPRGHPMVAPTAIQQGANLAANLIAVTRGRSAKAFIYVDKGSLATIGKRRAVADIKNFNLAGFRAWLIWCFVHVVSLVGFRSKFLVLSSWLMNYITYEKGNRFIIRRYTELADCALEAELPETNQK